ncbi:protein SIEVE ELEMENT OCCLUSION B-like [Malania oleifera]|uniref:protein SIEVE ELEMENT OCCLUSION B-like n=1 Tax=Malania oleifera TaxID=397392 RepID=UPI0025ADF207|nr:protein SIEVE ELEMENT OCCLUSION B-like [Malania oleifera]
MLHKREGGFCVMVWLPITTVDLIKDTTFNNKRMKMIGYTVRHPLLPDAWGSNEEATLVAVDQEGKVMCPNALHTFRIWGCKALQFSGFKERELWREEKWGIRLLLDTVDSFTLNERRSDDLICLYGGVKEEWLRDFQREATKLMNQRDMIYVGKSNSTKEQISTLLTHCNTIDTWRHYKTVRHFWARLTSILHVGHQLVHVGENDVVLNEAKSLLALDGHREGWALFGTVGGSEMVAAAGESILPALKRCAERQVVETSGRSMILVALKECIGSSNNVGIMWPQAANHCCCMAMARDFDCKYSKNPMGTQCSQTMAPHTMSRCCCRHP